MRDTSALPVALAGLAGAALLFWLGSDTPVPRPLTRFTEERQNPLAEHLVTREELGLVPARPRHHYPVRVMPMVTDAIIGGFAPGYLTPDQVVNRLPSEAMW